MSTTTILRREWHKVIGADYIKVTAELSSKMGDQRPHFAIGADIWEKRPDGKLTGRQRKTRRYEADSGGCLHEEILKYFPELAALVRVHLADDEGTPMHALANGWYFYSGKAHEHDRYQQFADQTPHEVAADALHIAPVDLPEGMTREEFTAFVEALSPVWAEQASIARQILTPKASTK